MIQLDTSRDHNYKLFRPCTNPASSLSATACQVMRMGEHKGLELVWEFIYFLLLFFFFCLGGFARVLFPLGFR